ncbi:MAG: P-loop NTPase [Pseudomonadota bacterium]|nr:P-loop NTPase [Pseudomonadota bacterium]
MTTDEIREICRRFYPTENIAAVKLLGSRLIVEIKNLAENPDTTAQLKQNLALLLPDKKISVVFVEDKNANLSTDAMEKWNLPNIKKIIGVASGKGGVGKSTTAVNLALALSKEGKKTALLDADIYGPSIPTMLGYEGQPLLSSDGETFLPFEACGIKSVSIGSLISRDTPIIWRGVKISGALEQLMTQTNWGEIDIMVIDMPPGTGDIQITLSQRASLDGVVIVSTPQDIALIDAIKGVNMFKKTGTPILGIIENMSYFICPCCGERSDIFGHEGARQTAKKLGEVFLGEIPLDMAIRENADKGCPVVLSQPDSPYSRAYTDIAKKIIARIG